MKKYRKLEKGLASTVASAVKGGDEPDSGEARDGLKALALATSYSKVQTAVERLAFHTSRGVKVLAFANYHETISFVNALAFIANAQDHHPDLSVHYNRCVVRFNTHDVGGISETDFDCASRIDALLD